VGATRLRRGSGADGRLDTEHRNAMPSVAQACELEPTYILSEGLASYLEQRGTEDGVTTSTELSSTAYRRSSLGVRLVDAHEAESLERPGMLLRSRLRAAAWVIWCALVVLFVRQVSLSGHAVHPYLTGALLVVAVGVLLLLYGPRSLTEPQLRGIELLLFGVIGVQLLVYQTAWMLRYSATGNEVELVATFDKSMLGYAVLMLAYGMFMPNGARRTACMMAPLMLGPVVTAAFLCWIDPRIAAAVPPIRLGEAAGILAGCAGIALFGTHTIAALRQEAKRARRLGQYRLKRPLGRGGMGEVYLAEHQLLKRPCAVKAIRPQQVDDPVALSRFEREVRAMAKLSHWHTVEVFDYGRTEDGTFYYVMEYLPGLNLVELVERGGPMPPGRVIHFLEQTCAALGEAHRQGMVHRDLKPANIMAAYRGDEFDVTKLLDFGLVLDHHDKRLAEEDTEESALAGSPAYMSPEQARGNHAVGPQSDLYSLGAVGYYLLTGRPPFERPTLLRMVLAHVREPVTPPSAHRLDIPRDLERIVLRCLEKSPSQRFASAQELRQALLECRDARSWTRADAQQWWQTYAPEKLQEQIF
jgi:serine/threonine-protein kinase